ncbi:hypothetical protein EAE99_006752 [Botrytis elliptica]|nr:hypothetical protein EAE99_006752 [Botrytis elliptica]
MEKKPSLTELELYKVAVQWRYAFMSLNPFVPQVTHSDNNVDKYWFVKFLIDSSRQWKRYDSTLAS